MLAAILSMLLPGLGQLGQGRVVAGFALIALFVASLLLCLILIGFVLVPIVWIAGIIDALLWRPPTS